MSPEDVLLEAMTAAAMDRDSNPDLRPRMCQKLRDSIERERDAVETIYLRELEVYANSTPMPKL